MFPEDWRLVFGPFDIGVQRAASVIHCLNCIHCVQCKHYKYSKKRRRKIERSTGTKWLEWCKMFHWSLLFLCIGQLYSCGRVQYSRKPKCNQQITWGGWQRYLKMLFFSDKENFPTDGCGLFRGRTWKKNLEKSLSEVLWPISPQRRGNVCLISIQRNWILSWNSRRNVKL